jgi:hypothetical protein
MWSGDPSLWTTYPFARPAAPIIQLFRNVGTPLIDRVNEPSKRGMPAEGINTVVLDFLLVSSQLVIAVPDGGA